VCFGESSSPSTRFELRKRYSVTDPIRAGFYAENLLLYSEQAKSDGILPLPIGENHLFAPVALGVSDDV